MGISTVFNSEPLKFGQRFDPPDLADLESPNLKYADYDFAREHSSPYIKRILAQAPIVGDRKHVLVDVKVHELQSGEVPCIPGWHLDTTVDPLHDSRPERHHLFVSGDFCRTRFIAQPVELEVDPSLNPKQLTKSYQSQLDNRYPDLQELEVPACQYVDFGRFDFHRGGVSSGNEVRLLIRVTESDLVKPSKRLHTEVSKFRNGVRVRD